MPVAIRYEPRDRDLSVRWIRYDIHGLASSHLIADMKDMRTRS